MFKSESEKAAFLATHQHAFIVTKLDTDMPCCSLDCLQPARVVNLCWSQKDNCWQTVITCMTCMAKFVKNYEKEQRS